MSIKQKIIFSSGLLFFLIPALAFAASAPPNIKEVTAKIENGELRVTWQKVSDPVGIKNYRVYFSRASILGHDGDYDDFESTAGPETAYVFRSLPQKEGKIYLAVMAVNDAGQESEGFETEAVVEIPVSIPKTSSSPVQVKPDSGPMLITSVVPLSSTGLVLAFTKPVDPSGGFRKEDFSITGSGGVTLEIKNIAVDKGFLVLTTIDQVPDFDYQVTFKIAIPAEDGTASPPTGPIPFKGFKSLFLPTPSRPIPPSNENPGSTVSSLPPPDESSVPYGRNPFLGNPIQPVPSVPSGVLPENPVYLLLEPERLGNGLYNVVAKWARGQNSKGDLSGFGIYTTYDGTDFRAGSTVPPENTSVQFSGLKPGVFGVRVTAKDARGQESSGIQKVIVLPATGGGLIGIILVSGFVAGKMRRKRNS